MEIVPANLADVEQTAICLAKAFANDSHLRYFFQSGKEARDELAHEFFALLMTARLELAKPVMVLKDAGQIAGCVMGYDTVSSEWLPDTAARWQLLMQREEGLERRLGIYDEASEKFKPVKPFFYLGVIGVLPSAQGHGFGKSLIDAFTGLSNADSQSEGVYLETFEEPNVAFYKRCGFELLGAPRLDDSTEVFCMFQPKAG